MQFVSTRTNLPAYYVKPSIFYFFVYFISLLFFNLSYFTTPKHFILSSSSSHHYQSQIDKKSVERKVTYFIFVWTCLHFFLYLQISFSQLNYELLSLRLRVYLSYFTFIVSSIAISCASIIIIIIISSWSLVFLHVFITPIFFILFH